VACRFLSEALWSNILVVDYDCDRILYWSSNPSTNAVPSGVIGASTIYSDCDEDCFDSSAFPCFDEPEYVTVDCYGGVWVYDYGSNGVYYFSPPGTLGLSGLIEASFGLTGPSGTFTDDVDDWDSLIAIQFDLGTCEYLAVSSDENVFIVQISFSNSIAQGATSSIIFGSSGSGGTGTDYSNTNSLDDIGGIAWDVSSVANFGYIWVADGDNERIVYFNALAGAPAASSAAVSSPSNSPTGTLSHGASPSNSPTNSNSGSGSLSHGASPSNSPSRIPASASNSPGVASASNSPVGSSGSCLTSWLF